MRRPWWVREPDDLAAKKDFQQAGLKASLAEDTHPQVKRFIAAWLRHYPDASPGNILGRLNARDKRRAKSKVARASRKANR